MGYEAFRTAEISGWNDRATAYNETTGQVTTGAIPTLLAMAETTPGKRILDLCCGTGRAAGAVVALGAEAEGIDASEAMIEAARAGFPGARFDVGDAESIPRDDNSFDAVICGFGLLHVADPNALFQEAARVLKPGGRLALSHWVGPPESALFRLVFGTMQKLADMSVAPPAPPPFALSTEDAMRGALQDVGLTLSSVEKLPLVFTAAEGRFPEQFRKFAVRAAMILDLQSEETTNQIYSALDEQLTEYLVDGQYRVPMPAFAVSATLDR